MPANASTVTVRLTKKRGRQTPSSPEQLSPEFTHASKMSALSGDEINPMLAMIKKMLDENYSKLSSEVSAASDSIKTELSKRIDDLSVELRKDIDGIDKKVDALGSSVDVKINAVSDEIKVCRERIDGAEDDFLRSIRASELKILGLKHTANEDLNDLLNKIASQIGADLGAQMPMISRASKWVKNEQVPQTVVIIKFLAPHLKEEFYKRYLSYLGEKKQLTLDILGIGSRKERLTIGENLTPHHQKIFAACMALKKDGQIAQVFTSNGISSIKMKKGEMATPIKTQRDLDLFVAKNKLKFPATEQKSGPNSTSNHAKKSSQIDLT